MCLIHWDWVQAGAPVSEGGGGHYVFDTLGLGTGRVPQSVRGGGSLCV